MLIHSFVANTLGSSTTNPYLKARMLFSAVNLALTYSDEEQDQSAVEVLKRGSGNCEGFANLYLAALRAAGIPARQQSGYLYQPEKHINDEYVDMELGHIMFDALRHTWVEFYLSGLGWVHADPTFTYTYEINGQPIRFINWNYFANISNDRRYFYFRTGSTSTDAIAYSCVGNGLDVSFNAYMQSGPPPLPFSDIRGHWAASAISYCYEQGLITGMNEFCFMPEDTLTRAMFITMLGRLFEGCGGSISAENSTAAQFVDVDTNAYYGKYLGWAVENGIILGYGDGRFGPNDKITREQMCIMIANFLQMMQADDYTPAALGFRDNYLISYWALDAVSYCVGKNIITGMNGNLFAPQNPATRAQAAVILQRVADRLQP